MWTGIGNGVTSLNGYQLRTSSESNELQNCLRNSSWYQSCWMNWFNLMVHTVLDVKETWNDTRLVSRFWQQQQKKKNENRQTFFSSIQLFSCRRKLDFPEAHMQLSDRAVWNVPNIARWRLQYWHIATERWRQLDVFS